MRRLLAFGAAAVTLTVVTAFLVPLLAAVRVLAADRATDAAQLESQSLAAVLSTVNDVPTVTRIVDEQNARSANSAAVFLPSGETIGAGAGAPGADVQLARQGRAFTVSAGRGRAVLVPVRGPDGAITVVRVTVPDAVLHEGVSRTSVLLVCLGVGLVLVTVLLADRLAVSIVRPMDRLAGTASELEQGHLEARVETGGPAEVATVGHALNLLADRIDDLLAAEREAAADVSHGLRTPLTVLRLDAESLADPDERARLAGDVDDLEAAVTRVIDDARRPRGPVAATCDLAAEVRNLAAFWSTLAGAQQRPCTVELVDRPVVVGVPASDVAAAVEALLGNVFAHTPAGTAFRIAVDVTGRGDHSSARLVVEDDGRGFPPELRFGRGRSARGSTGLGLDIARRVAERAGGTFRTDRSPAGGARVELELPVLPAGSADTGAGPPGPAGPG